MGLAARKEDMAENWERWIGKTVDGRFPLQNYLGGSDGSDVFVSVIDDGVDPKRVAIKLVPADAATAEKRLALWKTSGELSHPNLLATLAAGRCELEGVQLIYVVEEYAEENLAQILPERALTGEEAKGVLAPMLAALQFLHKRGLVHGHIQPSNIFAIGDQVKLSSDGIAAAGEKNPGARLKSSYDPPEAAAGLTASGDVWRLGATLIEVLTRQTPARELSRGGASEVSSAVPEPFREIAKNCLRVDGSKRWTVEQISEFFASGRRPTANVEAVRATAIPIPRGEEKAAPASLRKPTVFSKWPYVVGIAAVIAVAMFFVARPRSSGAPADAGPVPTSTSETVNSSVPAGEKTNVASAGGSAVSPSVAGEGDVVSRVIPEIKPGAKRSVHGTIMVRVRVRVDAAGNVTKAKVEAGRGSRYFSRVALEAARNWKFSPATAGESGEREWKVRFEFSRGKTDASATRGKR